MRDELFYTQKIRGQDGNIACSVLYAFKARPGQNWDILNIEVVDTKGAIIAKDHFFSRDYRGKERYEGENSPLWLVSPSSKQIDIIAKAATHEGVTEEAPDNQVALALHTGSQHTLMRLYLPLDDSGHLGLLIGDVTQSDRDEASRLAEREEGYGIDPYRTACRNAVERTLQMWLNVETVQFGSKMEGIWYNPDAGNFTHVYNVGTTLNNMFVREHMAGFNKKTVSTFVYKDIEVLLHKLAADVLTRNSYDHDTVFKLRRNGMLAPQTVAIFDRVPAILPPPPGFTV
ncbi:MAG: hypothetical protein EON60_11030 [Alphaproteobacteria bacterium]|nr:MAG: hypothetical protein EON60_11030 [Alphaproteobacteria bacterium]